MLWIQLQTCFHDEEPTLQQQKGNYKQKSINRIQSIQQDGAQLDSNSVLYPKHSCLRMTSLSMF